MTKFGKLNCEKNNVRMIAPHKTTGRNLKGQLTVVVDGYLLSCLTSQQQVSVSQGRIYPDKFTYCHTEIKVANEAFYLPQLQYTDTRPTSLSADPTVPGAWQGSH